MFIDLAPCQHTQSWNTATIRPWNFWNLDFERKPSSPSMRCLNPISAGFWLNARSCNQFQAKQLLKGCMRLVRGGSSELWKLSPSRCSSYQILSSLAKSLISWHSEAILVASSAVTRYDRATLTSQFRQIHQNAAFIHTFSGSPPWWRLYQVP